ncbi:ATP-binding protein [Streptomyces lividans]
MRTSRTARSRSSSGYLRGAGTARGLLRARIISLASGTPRIRGQLKLFTALDLAGEPPRHPSEFDRLLKTALAERPRTFLVDEAQWLNGEAFEYFRYLWDEPSTQLAIIFVGGAGCHTVLRREPMLSSRVFIWQQFTRLTPDEVLEVIPLFHPVWAE